MLTCIDEHAIVVSFEPEGSQHRLEAGDYFKVEIVGSGDGEPEVSYVPDGLIIGAWAGARTRVCNKAGAELRT
jgi:hypothetical protein